MAINFLELATTLTYVGAKWLLEKKVNFMPCNVDIIIDSRFFCMPYI